MANTANLSALASFQAYVQEHGTELWSRIFYGFETAQLATVLEGVKGRYTLPLLTVGNDLAKRWTSTFGTENDNKAVLGQRTIVTALNKAEFSFVPTEWESNYMGFLRRTGQDPYDFPFEAFILMKLNEKLRKEMEDAVWNAVAAGSPANDDVLDETFDGFLHILADEITATNVTPVTTGSITSSNAVAKFRDMWATVDVAYKQAGLAILCSYTDYDNYLINYKDTYHQSPAVVPVASDYNGIQYEFGGGRTTIIPVPGFGSSRRVIMTPLDNLVIGMDGINDLNWNVEQNHWTIDIFGAFRVGVQYRTVESGVLVCNDQT